MGCFKLDILKNLEPKLTVISKKPSSQKVQIVDFLTTKKGVEDYYPFGMVMPGRNGGDYSFGFQGQLQDNEIKGKGNSVNYKYRMADSRLGRFFAVDPLAPVYPELTPYQFAANQPIHGKELEGLENNRYLHQGQGPNNDNIGLPSGVPSMTTSLIHVDSYKIIQSSTFQSETRAFEKVLKIQNQIDYENKLRQKAQSRVVMAEARAEYNRMQNPLYLMAKMSMAQDIMDIGIGAYDRDLAKVGVGFLALLIDLKLPVKVDLMGGKKGTAGFLNYDLQATKGIRDNVKNFGKHFPVNSVDEMIVNNPMASFMGDITSSLKSGSNLTIRGQYMNPNFADIWDAVKVGEIPKGYKLLKFRTQ